MEEKFIAREMAQGPPYLRSSSSSSSSSFSRGSFVNAERQVRRFSQFLARPVEWLAKRGKYFSSANKFQTQRSDALHNLGSLEKFSVVFSLRRAFLPATGSNTFTCFPRRPRLNHSI